MQEQQQKKKLKKSLEDLIEELKSVTKKMAVVYAPEIAEAVKEEHPDWDIYKMKKYVLDAFVQNGWNEQYIERVIRIYVPHLNEGNVFHFRQVTAWQTKHANKLKASSDKFISDTKNIPNPPEPEPKEKDNSEELDQEMHELGIAKFGETNKSIRELKGRIYESATDLFEALTNKNTPPDESDDLIVDYIKPTREFRRSLLLELDEGDRILMHNKLHYASVAIEDMLEILKEIDK